MKTSQKIILTIGTVLTVAVGAVCGYAIKVTNDAKKTANAIETDVSRDVRPVDTAAKEPMSILLMGIDEGTVTGDLDRTKDYVGRSDSLMYVALNPDKSQTTIASLDRDLYIQIAGKKTDSGNNFYSKLNSAYAYGSEEGGKTGAAKMTIETVETLLDVPVDHYVTINMQGMEDLIDAVGGIEVDNKYHFELDGVELYPGKQHLAGKEGLAYARFREYDAKTGMGDPEGDVGRQRRQREVVELIVRKILSLDSITNYQKIFKAVEKNVTTDLSWDQMINLAQGYTSVLDNVVQLQVQGQYHWFDGYYQIPSINALLEAQNTLKEQLGLEKATTLPNLAELDPNEYYFDDTHVDPDAGSRDYVDPYLYFNGHILTPYESIWTKNFDLPAITANGSSSNDTEDDSEYDSDYSNDVYNEDYSEDDNDNYTDNNDYSENDSANIYSENDNDSEDY